jgi:hypothetical protein
MAEYQNLFTRVQVRRAHRTTGVPLTARRLAARRQALPRGTCSAASATRRSARSTSDGWAWPR